MKRMIGGVGAAVSLLALLLVLVGLAPPVQAAPVHQADTASATYVILHSDTITNGNGTTVAPVGVFDSYSELTVQATGMVSGTLNFEGTIDGSNWKALLGTNVTSGSAAATTTAAGIYRLDVTGLASVRVRASGITTNTTDTIDVAGFLTAP